MSKKAGYTLAEVLVSVIIIGVIAAVCAPMMVRSVPNKNISMIKKAYYIVESITKDLINDSYYYPDMRSNCADITQGTTPNYTYTTNVAMNCYVGFDYTQSVHISGTTQDAGGNWKFARLFVSKLDTQQNLTDALARIAPAVETKTVATTDGMVYYFNKMSYSNSGDRNDHFELKIDVNGTEEPNAFAPTYQEGTTPLNQCSSFGSWTPNSAGGNYANRKFDRITLWIYYDGRIEIPYNQIEFVDAVNPKNTGI